MVNAMNGANRLFSRNKVILQFSHKKAQKAQNGTLNLSA